MEEQTTELKDYIDAFRRRRTSILIMGVTIFFISILLAMFWPPTYRSTATILIEEQEVPPDLIRSTITSFAAQRIQEISQRVMTRANLAQIIDKYGLYSSKRRFETTEEIQDRMRKDVNLDMVNADVIDPRSGRPTPATIAFTLSYDGESPDVTQKVASELTTLYLNENLKNRAEKATETYSFLSTEADKLSQHISELEGQIAAFKEKNVDRLPELTQLNMSFIERTDRDLLDVENQLRSLDDRKFYLDGQLAQINPLQSATPMVSDSGGPVMDPVTRLKMLRAEYASDSAKYAPDHPDVVRLRREIEGLEKQVGSVDPSSEQAKELAQKRGELTIARKKYSEDHPDVVRLTKEVASMEEALRKQQASLPEMAVAREQPDNPAYITLQAQIESVKSQMDALVAQRNGLKAKIAEYEKRVQQTPEAERQYLALKRDYDNSLRRYQDLKAKQMDAAAGRQLEKESKGERFSLIDPPQLPEEPVTPNRPAIIILGFLLSFGGGLGYAAVAEGVDRSVRGVRGLTALFNNPPLSVIPYMRNSADLARTARTKKIVLTVFAGSFVIVILLVHFLWIPLDVLWFRGLRKVDTVIGG